MKNTIKLLSIAILIITFACSKTKRYSKKLDDNKWEVKTLTVDGVSDANLPELKFNESDIHDKASKGWWYWGEEGHAEIAWQIRDKGKTFEFSNQADHVHGFEDVKASEQAINYSGVYKIIKLTRNSFEIESNETYGNKGKKVIIKMERKK
jgi:hypothetical protein